MPNIKKLSPCFYSLYLHNAIITQTRPFFLFLVFEVLYFKNIGFYIKLKTNLFFSIITINETSKMKILESYGSGGGQRWSR